jgi:Domain of unknown function (DUF1816)
MQEPLISVLDFLGLAWWVEIKTDLPRCTYYFGPFASSSEAEESKPGYIEDLQNEDAQGLVASVKRCKPPQLTIEEDLGEPRSISQSFSSQMP